MRQVDKDSQELQRKGWRVIDGRLMPPKDFFDRPLRIPYNQEDAMSLQKIFGDKVI